MKLTPIDPHKKIIKKVLKDTKHVTNRPRLEDMTLARVKEAIKSRFRSIFKIN